MSKIFLDAEGTEHVVNPKDEQDVRALNALGLNEKKAVPAKKTPSPKTEQ